MTQTSRLVIEIDSSAAQRNADLVNRELERMMTKGNQAASSVDNLGSKTTKAAKEMDAASSAARTLVGYIGGIAAVSKAIALTDQYSQMASRIRNATDSAAEYNLVQDRILQTANGTYRALTEAQEVYLSISGTLKSLGYSTNQILDLTDSLSYSFTINAARADQAQSAQDALSKSFAKGKLDADSWLSIITAADNVVRDMAAATGKTEEQIRKLGANGEISLNELAKSLIASRDRNKELADAMSTSVKDGFTALTNSISDYLGRGNEANGVTSTISAGLVGLSKNLDDVVRIGAVVASLYAGRLVAAYTASTVALIADTRATMANTGAKMAAATAGRAMLGVFGGPVGLVATLGLAAVSMYALRDSTNEVTPAIARQGKSVAQLAEEYKKLSLAQAITESKALRESVEESEKIISQSIGRLQNLKMTGPFESFDRELFDQIIDDLKSGSITGEQALKRLVDSGKFEQSTIDSVAEYAKTIDNSTSKIQADKQATQLLNEVTKNLTIGANQSASAIKNQGNAAQIAAGQFDDATKAYDKFIQSQNSNLYRLTFVATAVDNGVARDNAELLAQYYEMARAAGQVRNGITYLTDAQKSQYELSAKANETIKSQLKAEAEALKDRNKQESEATRLAKQELKERQNNYKNLIDSIADESTRIDKEYSKQVDLIKEFADPDEQSRLLALTYAQAQQKQAELGVQNARNYNAYFEFENTRADLIETHYEQEKVLAQNNAKYSEDERKKITEALEREKKHELALLKHAEAEQLLYAQQGYLTQIDYMRQRYALEREEIALTQGKTEEWRKAMLAASMLNQGNDTANMQFSSGAAIAGLKADLNGTGEYFDAQQQLAQRMAIVQEGLDTETLAIQDAVDLRKQIYQDYYNSITELTLSKGEEIFGSLASIAKDTAGEQSAAYRAMFAVSKGFAIAESAIKIQQALAQALGDPTAITPAQKLMNYGIIASQAANIVSSLSSVAPQGFATGGKINGPGTGTSDSLLIRASNEEYMLRAYAANKIGTSTLDYINRTGELPAQAMRTGTRVDNAIAAQSRSSGSGGNVYIYNNTSSAVSTQKDDAGNTYITIDDVRREIAARAPAAVANDLSRGPNTPMGKALRQNYKVERQF